MDLTRFFDVLNLDKKERDEVFHSTFPLVKRADRDIKFASDDLEEKVRDRLYDLALLYFSTGDNYDKLDQITTIGHLRRRVFLDELKRVDQINDPASQSSQLSGIFQEIRQHVAYEVGVQLIEGSSDPDPNKNMDVYIGTGLEYLDTLRK